MVKNAKNERFPANKYWSLFTAYALNDEKENALKYLRLYTQTDVFRYNRIRYLKDDPMYDNIRELPEFREIFDEMEKYFWEEHERIKASLKEQGLL